MLGGVRRNFVHSVLHGHTIPVMEPKGMYNTSARNASTAVHDYVIARFLCFAQRVEQLSANWAQKCLARRRLS